MNYSPNKPKVAITIPTLHNAGAERQLSNLLFEFVNHFEIDLILYTDEIQYEIPKNLNLIILGISNSSKISVFSKFLRFFERINSLRKVFKNNKYALVFSFLDGHNVLTYYALKLANSNAKQVVAERTIIKEFFENNTYAEKYKSFMLPQLKFVYRRVDEIITISHAMKDFMANDLDIRNTYSVVYNGFDRHNFYYQKDKTKDFEFLPKEYTESTKKILCIGRFHTQKNQPYLITIMEELIKWDSSLVLFFIGKGEKEDEVKAAVANKNLENNIKFLGWHKDIAPFLRTADLLVSPSKWEGTPNVVIEAMACGCPVVTSISTSAIFEMVEDGKWADIVPLENTELFKEKMKEGLTKPISFKSEMSKYAISKFDFDKTKKEYLSLLLKNLNKS